MSLTALCQKPSSVNTAVIQIFTDMRSNLSALTERSVLKLGAGYKGNSNIYRSIGQNVLITSDSYNYSGGFFGDNSKHGGKSTRNISSKDNLKTDNDFYNLIRQSKCNKKNFHVAFTLKIFIIFYACLLSGFSPASD